MKNKKTLTKVALTTGLALTAVAPYGVGHAEETDQLQVQIQEESKSSLEIQKTGIFGYGEKMQMVHLMNLLVKMNLESTLRLI